MRGNAESRSLFRIGDIGTRSIEINKRKEREREGGELCCGKRLSKPDKSLCNQADGWHSATQGCQGPADLSTFYSSRLFAMPRYASANGTRSSANYIAELQKRATVDRTEANKYAVRRWLQSASRLYGQVRHGSTICRETGNNAYSY